MTRVDFYSNAPDKLMLARQIVQKAHKQDLQIFILSEDSQVLNELNTRLWTDIATSFIPHCLSTDVHAMHTPIVLGIQLGNYSRRDLLINLNAHTPDCYQQFERLIEIVSTDEADRLAARQRWSHYKQNNHPLTNHDMSK